MVRLIIENKIKIKLRSIINYSLTLYKEQGYEFDITKVLKELNNFILDRLKNYSKEKGIRLDIIESSILSNDIDELYNGYKKAEVLNRNIKKEIGQNVIGIYKRSSNILNNEINKNKLELSNSIDVGLFKNEFEKNLYKKIQEIKKYFFNVDKNDNFEKNLKELFKFKQDVDLFFDNVKVNDENHLIKKNRLELLNLLCKNFDNFFNFSKIEQMKKLIFNFKSKDVKIKKTQNILEEREQILLKWVDWVCQYLLALQFQLKFVICFIKIKKV